MAARDADAARANAVLTALVRQFAALRMLLIRKGIISQEELDYAEKEMEADLAVELTINPQEVEAVEKKFFDRELRSPQAEQLKRPKRGKRGRRHSRRKP